MVNYTDTILIPIQGNLSLTAGMKILPDTTGVPEEPSASIFEEASICGEATINNSALKIYI